MIQMKYKYLLVSFLIISIFLSINMVVATDVDLNNLSDTQNCRNSLDFIDIESSQSFNEVITEDSGDLNVGSSDNEVITEDSGDLNVGSSDDEEILSDGYEVDVRTSDGIVGDFDVDPILLAVDKINGDGVESATINIHNGTYVLWPAFFIEFYNVNELVINGVDGDVIFEPLIEEGASANAAFGFANPANVIFNNITFDLSKITSSRFTPAEMPETETGAELYVTLNDCTFISNSHQLDTVYANTNYINCKFVNFTGDYFFTGLATDTYTYFENCIFSNLNITRISSGIDKNHVNVTFNGVWLGQNTLPTYTQNTVDQGYQTYDIFTYGPINTADKVYSLPLKYAIFSVSENYLDNNQYEIIGKLTWNGTDSSEGMENFSPMTVTLTSTTGIIQDAILINGTFKANYTSSVFEHKVTAKLDSEEINLTFESKAKDYTFDISEITDVKVGDTKEITITLPNDATGKVVISIGDNKFNGTVDGNTTKVNITGFTLGENIINITYSGNERYESRTKNITVFAVKETTIITVQNVSAIYNVAKDLVITLTDVNGKVLANKTINVVVGTINQNLTTNGSGQVSVNIDTLAPNTYVANVTFAGDELYINANATANVIVNKVVSSITASKVTATYNVAKNLVITLTANGKPLNGQKVAVKVGTISKTLTTDAKGQVSVDVSKLTPKTYTATFTYAGDSINAGSKNTAKVVVNKAKPKLTAKKATFKAKKKTKKYSIVLKDNKGKAIKKAKVTLKVKGKTYKATTNNKGKATFKITKLNKKGKTTANVKFGGNNYFKSISKKVNIIVKK